MRAKIYFKGLSILFFLLYLVSCSPVYHQTLGKREAQLGPETPIKKDLLSLPEPDEKIVVAVYKFRDQTGQYKAIEAGASWSTAVTQGATNILIRALEESGWFVPIERENISNLLNERKIIRSSREQYEGTGNILLPPLLFAGVLIEGGIVSYETNVLTGGAGVRYFGTDASAQYREDRVSIYLRAVSTSNGKILKTVYTTKSILSQEVSMGVFRYVKFKRLLEAETGYTYNEPTEMAVTEAIEKAVQSLIIEGILDNLWALKHPAQSSSEIFTEYKKEKEENLELDLIGRPYSPMLRDKVFLNISSTGQWYNGDYSQGPMKPGGIFRFGFALNRSLYLQAGFGSCFISVSNKSPVISYVNEIDLIFLLNHYGSFSPFVKTGFGIMTDFGDPVAFSNEKWLPYLSASVGAEYLFTKRFGITGGAFYKPFMNDQFDGESIGDYNDSFWGAELGLKFYF